MSGQMKTFFLMIIEYVFFFVCSVLLIAVISKIDDFDEKVVLVRLLFAIKVVISTIGLVVNMIKFFAKKMLYPIGQSLHVFGTLMAFAIMILAYDGLRENLLVVPISFLLVGGELTLFALSIMARKRVDQSFEYDFGNPPAPENKKQVKDGEHTCAYCGEIFDGDVCPACGAKRKDKNE